MSNSVFGFIKKRKALLCLRFFLISCSKKIQIGLNTEFSLSKDEKIIIGLTPDSLFLSEFAKDCYQNKIIENKKSNVLFTFLFCSNEIKTDYFSIGYIIEPFKMTNSNDTVICYKKIKDSSTQFIFQEPGFTHFIMLIVSNNSKFDTNEFFNKRLRAKYFVAPS